MLDTFKEYLHSHEFNDIWEGLNRDRLPFLMPLIINQEYDTIGGKTDIHGTANSYNIAQLHFFLSRHKGKFFDLGCGIGKVLITAGHHDWEAYGCDINRTCIKKTSEYAQAAIAYQLNNRPYLGPDTILKAVWADMFQTGHEGFSPIWLTGASGEALMQTTKDIPNINPYTALGIDTKEIDLFFHHQAVPAKCILELFELIAREDAMLIYLNRFDPYPIMDHGACRLIYHDSSGFCLYAK
ncbi:MAG: hypothetical protein NDI94_05335 [Candidatus Woesearchaeota archaeon]|nr:hypothetical protein [Candidatus Woesearchaeota archaeon]